MEDLGVDRRIILKLILNEVVGYVWSGLIWLRTEKSTRLSVDAVSFHEMLREFVKNNFGTLCIYRVYTKEWCGFHTKYIVNRTILLCIPCIRN